MSFLQQISRPLREQATSFFLSNTGNRSSALLSMSKRCASHMEMEDTQLFQEKVAATKTPLLAYFYKPRCQFCKIFEDKLQDVVNNEKEVDLVIKVNVDNGRGIAEKYKVDAVPTVVGFKGGKAVDKIIGNVQKDMIEKMVSGLK